MRDGEDRGPWITRSIASRSADTRESADLYQLLDKLFIVDSAEVLTEL